MGGMLFRSVLFLSVGFVLSACDGALRPDADRPAQPVSLAGDADLNSIMINAAAPDEAVAYFQRAIAQNPADLSSQRGLATSLIRAQRATEAVPVWQNIVSNPDATHEDRVNLADTLIRTGDWNGAEAQLDQITPTYESFDRYRIEAIVADSNQEWQRADSFYQTAIGLTTQPAKTLNNWGYSHLVRGEFARAEELFVDAVRYDSTLFTAKNNLVIARASQGNYQMPLVQMTQTERAQLLHTAGLMAIRRGDTEIGRRLFQNAVDTYPQHFEAAARALRTLDSSV